MDIGIPFARCFDLFFRDTHINKHAVEDYVSNLLRRGRNRESQIAALLRAVTCLDITTLCGDDTESNVRRICFKAEHPIKENVLANLGFDPSEITCGAVCVYPSKVSSVVTTLEAMSSSIPVAAVAAGFPSGQYPIESRLAEIQQCVNDGAREIDIVISRDLVLCGDWKGLYEEVKLMKEACGPHALLKTIIATGELGSLSNVYKASMICMAAGTDYIKTSTGKETVNATLPVGTVMTRAIRDYYEATGHMVGFKAAGGVRTSKDVLLWIELMLNELPSRWLHPHFFRIGASSLLGDIEQNITEYVAKNVGRSHLPFI